MGTGGGDPPGPDCNSGEPLEVPEESWTYVSFPGTACGYAGEAGIAVNPTSASDDLLIVLDGGGACFNESDCASSFLDGLNEPDVFGHIEWIELFNRTSPSNPFADWSYVFVPSLGGSFADAWVHWLPRRRWPAANDSPGPTALGACVGFARDRRAALKTAERVGEGAG